MDQASNGLRLTDLNDFINPSKSCIKPLITENQVPQDETVYLKKNSTKSLVNDNENEKAKKNVGKIKLDDCLACSGCVTSAEVVFIEQQSISEFFEFISRNNQMPLKHKKLIAVSVSPQSVISLAHSLKMTFKHTIKLILDYFKNICGAKWVFNHFEINDICLYESTYEFIELYKKAKKENKILRIFSSSCPGWACYAEKRCSSDIVNELSHTRSIQGVMGGLLKKTISENADTIYHLAVMPCFDRKLEASRSDMVFSQNEAPSSNIELNSIKETDLVVTTFELYNELIKSYNLENDIKNNIIPNVYTLSTSEIENFDSIFQINSIYSIFYSQNTIFSRNIGGESGGLAINIFINACQILFNLKLDIVETTKNGVNIETVTCQDPIYEIKDEYIKSSDFYEIWLEKLNTDQSKTVMLRFAKVYGFRNIQNMLIRIKKLPPNYYQYIEVMACPNGGCLNGGGQVLFHSHNSIYKKNQLIKELRNDFMKIASQPTDNLEHVKQKVDQLKINHVPLSTTFHPLVDQSLNVQAKNNTNNLTEW